MQYKCIKNIAQVYDNFFAVVKVASKVRCWIVVETGVVYGCVISRLKWIVFMYFCQTIAAKAMIFIGLLLV